MSSLDESLRQILAVGGVQTAALIDVATGMVVRSAGAQENANLPAAAASIADAARAARAARAAQGPGEPGGELEGIVLSTGRRVHFTRILQPGPGPGPGPGEGLLLFIDLDRALANTALAALRAGQLVPAVLT